MARHKHIDMTDEVRDVGRVYVTQTARITAHWGQDDLPLVINEVLDAGRKFRAFFPNTTEGEVQKNKALAQLRRELEAEKAPKMCETP
jgi:hypothetical protein